MRCIYNITPPKLCTGVAPRHQFTVLTKTFTTVEEKAELKAGMVIYCTQFTRRSVGPAKDFETKQVIPDSFRFEGKWKGHRVHWKMAEREIRHANAVELSVEEYEGQMFFRLFNEFTDAAAVTKVKETVKALEGMEDF